MKAVAALVVCAALSAAFVSNLAVAGDDGMIKWKRGQGWGWVWGKDDQVGALNEMTDATKMAAMKAVKTGRVFDLGLPMDRNSYHWDGHGPLELMMYRTPHGIKTMRDFDFMTPEGGNTSGTAWQSAQLFMSDNTGTKFDGLGHVTVGADDHFYNGFKSADAVGDFGMRKCDATTIPPVIARGVLIDVAAYKGVDSLPSGYEITVADLKGALAAEHAQIKPGDVVLVRIGMNRYWGEAGHDHKALEDHNYAGLGMDAAHWLIADQGAMVIGGDTTGVEVYPPKKPGSSDPMHVYALIEQGVHIIEMMNLEPLSVAKVYEFTFMLVTNDVRGSIGGFDLRPIAIQ
jgi:kynurenine formamidase